MQLPKCSYFKGEKGEKIESWWSKGVVALKNSHIYPEWVTSSIVQFDNSNFIIDFTNDLELCYRYFYRTWNYTRDAKNESEFRATFMKLENSDWFKPQVIQTTDWSQLATHYTNSKGNIDKKQGMAIQVAVFQYITSHLNAIRKNGLYSECLTIGLCVLLFRGLDWLKQIQLVWFSYFTHSNLFLFL